MSSEPIKPLNNHEQTVTFCQVKAKNGIQWLTQAYSMVKSFPLGWLGCMILLSFIFILCLQSPILQVAAVILTPIFTAGLMIGCVDIRRQKQFTVNTLFAGFSRSLMPLATLGLIYLLCSFGCSIIAFKIASWMGVPASEITPQMLSAGGDVLTKAMQSLMIPILIFMGLMIPILMANWFAPALVVFYQQSPVEALKKSFYACAANMKAFTLFGIYAMIAVILISFFVVILSALLPIAIAMIGWMLANLFFMSVLFAAIFTSFEDVFNFVDDQPNHSNDSASEELQQEKSQKDKTDDDNSDDEGPTSITI